jgi:lipopolysaccharide biosynthesis glycosyltransferase
MRNNKMTPITIAYAPDNNRITLTLTSMASILKNAKRTDEIEFVILYSPKHLDEKFLPTFENLQSIKSYKTTLIKIDEKIFDNFPCSEWVTVEAWFCSLLADLLPNNDKVLYMHCDTIVRDSLANLFKTDLGNNWVGVIGDIYYSKQNSQRLGLNDNIYFNSGVILVNAKAWRKADFYNKLRNIVLIDRKITNEQDALNKACDTKKFRLLPKYNYMQVWWRKSPHEYDETYLKDYEKASDKPLIVHFIGVKPTSLACKNKFACEFSDYTKLVPAYDTLQKEIKNTNKMEKRPFWKKAINFIKEKIKK